MSICGIHLHVILEWFHLSQLLFLYAFKMLHTCRYQCAYVSVLKHLQVCFLLKSVLRLRSQCYDCVWHNTL